MYSVRYGGREGRVHTLVVSPGMVAVRTVSRVPVLADQPAIAAAHLSGETQEVLDSFRLLARFPEAGVEVIQARGAGDDTALRDRAREALKREPEVRFAGRVLREPEAEIPVLYTENLFVKFQEGRSVAECRAVLARYGLEVRGELDFAANAWFVAAPEGTGLNVFPLAERLLEEPMVELCHPELIREVRGRQVFPQQWHLRRTLLGGATIDAHVNAEAAWRLTQGEGTVIAVIDDGVDVEHEEFASPGKIHLPQNVSLPAGHPSRGDARPGSGDNHGTSCAGVACADGRIGASGVAPRARLMPIRLASGLGSMAEADAFVYAARNGADVISCSWGPRDGRWWDPADPQHQQEVPLPDSTRLAIEWAVRHGREGKGCVIVWAAGNGNESVDLDGYASHPSVMAVAACNDAGKRSVYSDFGRAVWCAFPSSHGEPSRTPGIWTTDRSGPAGYNPGQTNRGDARGNYTSSFGGTSSAAPGVAGVAALVLARNPTLRWNEVRDVIRRSCTPIDAAGGRYDDTGRSPFYGYGRVDAGKAVELARPAPPEYLAVHTAVQTVPIADLAASQLALAVAEEMPLKEVRVLVDVEHTRIGQLVVSLAPPAELSAAPVVLHSRTGGSADDVKRSYDASTTPALAGLAGRVPRGTWTLRVVDEARQETGRIRSFSLVMRF